MTLRYNILTAVLNLDVENEKQAAQLKLMEYGIDAENEDEIVQYKSMDETQIKSDKIRMEAKLSALENKLQRHEKHLPNVIELEQQEVMLVYQEYIKELKLDKEKIGKVLDSNEMFTNMIYPERFLDIYKRSM